MKRLALLFAVAAGLGVMPGEAGAASAACPAGSGTYTGPCGPTFAIPGWGDAGGWKDPDQYETIQLTDIDGDGADELFARSSAGVIFYTFDKSFGQWRPLVDSNDVPLVLTDFADPPPLTVGGGAPPKTDWTLPQYYDTIQATDLDGNPGAEVFGRSADGIVVYRYTPNSKPTPGGASKNGKFEQVTTSGPFADPGAANPSIYSTIQAADFDGQPGAEIFGRTTDGVAVYSLKDNTLAPWNTVGAFGDADGGAQPQFFTVLQAARPNGGRRAQLVGRTADGIGMFRLSSTDVVNTSRFSHPFSDNPQGSDCPFVSGSQTCLGAGPGYYATLGFADIDGDGTEELVARASDGLRVRRYQGNTPDGWEPLPTLTEPSDANHLFERKYWESLRLADVNGDGKAEVLERLVSGVNVWSYDPAKRAWSQLTAGTALQLTDAPWGSDRSYYSTLEVGDVDGDGSDELIGRGPHGIRTWFYNRGGGTGGWAPYQAPGYPDFTGDSKAAFDALTALAKASNVIPSSATTVRDVYATRNTGAQDLAKIRSGIVNVAQCTTQTSPVPPRYATCKPPDGVAAAVWTDVVNKIIGELFWAENVQTFFFDSDTGLETAWDELFLEQTNELTALETALQLEAEAQAKTLYEPNRLFDAIWSIAGEVIGLLPQGGPLSAELSIMSDVLSLAPSGSETLSDRIEGTYSEMQTAFAQGVTETHDVIEANNALIRSDGALLELLGRLQQAGTWTLDKSSLTSVSRQGFTRWLYSTLLPSMYTRYSVTSCLPDQSGVGPRHDLRVMCSGPPTTSKAMLGDAQNFTVIGPSPTTGAGFPPPPTSPCQFGDGTAWHCNFVPVRDDVASTIWGPQTQACAFNGTVVWQYPPTCTLGIDPIKTIPEHAVQAAEWPFPLQEGSPLVPSSINFGAVRVRGAAARSGGAAPLLRLRALMPARSRLNYRRASVRVVRLLAERGGAGELVQARRGTRVRLRRISGGRLRVALAVRGARARLPRACSGIRPGIDLADVPITLRTHLVVRDRAGRSTRLRLPSQWACRRNRLGAVTALAARRPQPSVRTRPALSLAISGRRRVRLGRATTLTLRVRNGGAIAAHDVIIRADLPPGHRSPRARGTRRGGGHLVWRIRRLGPGRAITRRLHVRVTHGGSREIAVSTQALGRRASVRTISIRARR